MKLENLKFGDRYVLANGKICVCVKVAHNLKSGDFLFKQSNFLNGTESYTTIQIDVETGKWIGGNDDKFSIIAKYERPYLWTQTVFGDMFLTKGGVNAVYVSETEVEYEDLNDGRRYKKENATYIVVDGELLTWENMFDNEHTERAIQLYLKTNFNEVSKLD